MNLPNKLTVFRIILVPIIVLFLLCEQIPGRYFMALLLFFVASYTDYLDGKIARKNNLITDFGKLMDPIADKILVMSIFICFSVSGDVPAIVTILVVVREFLVTSIRILVLESKKIVISANIYGKLKTVSQMATVFGILIIRLFTDFLNNLVALPFDDMIFYFMKNSLILICSVMTVLSGAIYVFDSRKYIKIN